MSNLTRAELADLEQQALTVVYMAARDVFGPDESQWPPEAHTTVTAQIADIHRAYEQETAA